MFGEVVVWIPFVVDASWGRATPGCEGLLLESAEAVVGVRLDGVRIVGNDGLTAGQPSSVVVAEGVGGAVAGDADVAKSSA